MLNAQIKRLLPSKNKNDKTSWVEHHSAICQSTWKAQSIKNTSHSSILCETKTRPEEHTYPTDYKPCYKRKQPRSRCWRHIVLTNRRTSQSYRRDTDHDTSLEVGYELDPKTSVLATKSNLVELASETSNRRTATVDTNKSDHTQNQAGIERSISF